MHRKDHSRIRTSDLPDGGKVVVQFVPDDTDHPGRVLVGVAIFDRDGFVRTFDAELDETSSSIVLDGGSRIESRIAKAVCAAIPDSSSVPPVSGLKVRGLSPVLFEDDWHRRRTYPASRSAVDWRMGIPSAEDDASPSWIRSHPSFLGMSAPRDLIELSEATRTVETPGRAALRGTVLAFPILGGSPRLLAEIARRIDAAGDRAAIFGIREIASAASSAYGTTVTPRSFEVAQMRGIFATKQAEPEIEFLLRTAALLPASWMPTDEDGTSAFKHLVHDVRRLLGGKWCGPSDVATLLGHSAGRWKKFLISFDVSEESRKAPSVLRARNALGDVSDYLDWAADNLVEPFVSFAPADKEARRRIALALATDGGGIRSVFARSVAWHASPALPTTRLVTEDDERWAPCIEGETRRTRDGTGIVELMSPGDLRQEGEALRHCVGTGSFAERCFEGRARILSVRRGDERLSTVELAFDANGRPEIAQHRGSENERPCPSAKEAVAMLLEDAANGRTAIRRPEPQAIREIEYALDGVSPADFRRFIRRDLSRLDWSSFGDEVSRISETAAPGLGVHAHAEYEAPSMSGP